MPYEMKESFGALFKNDQKGNEKAPSYKGDIMLGGVVYELAGWVKDGGKGKFFSLSGKVKGDKPKPVPVVEDDIFEDAPF